MNCEINIKNSGAGEFSNNNISTHFLDMIEPYKPGSKLSHISWKHFATLSVPYVRKFYFEECANI